MPLLRLLAAFIPETSAQFCPIPGLPCGSLPEYLGTIASRLLFMLIAITAAMAIFYAVRLAAASSDESTITETRGAYLHMIFGAVVAAGAAFLAATVPPGSYGFFAGPAISGVLVPVARFFFAMTATALTINIAYHGGQLIFGQDDGAAGNARQGIFRGVIGLSIVLLAGIVTGAFATSSSGALAEEILGIGNFIITIFGVLALVSMVVAGIFLVVSADEQLKDRAKKVIITLAVAVIVVMAGAVIIRVFF